MKSSFQAILLVIGFIQGGTVEVDKIVFIGTTGVDRKYTKDARVMFDKVLTDPYNIYHREAGVVLIPGDGVYYVTIRGDPPRDNRIVLRLIVDRPGVSRNFVVYAERTPTSQSAPFMLKYRDQLSVVIYRDGTVQSQTLWSVFYVGYTTVAFTGRVRGRSGSRRIPFDDVITQTANFVISEDNTYFTIPVDGLYLVHIGADPVNDYDGYYIYPYDLDLGVITWQRHIAVEAIAEYGYLTSSTSIFPLRRNDPLYVERNRTRSTSPVAESGTIFSFVKIGERLVAAFRGDLAHHDKRVYEVDEVVKFGNVIVDTTKGKMYNNITGIFTIDKTGKYAVSIRSGPAVDYCRNDRIRPEGAMRTGDSLSLILKNKTNHVLLAAVAEKGMSSGTTVGLYLLEGDELRVVAVENKRIRDAGISIAYVSKQCCY